jgi:probable phosphoglycerate mutase
VHGSHTPAAHLIANNNFYQERYHFMSEEPFLQRRSHAAELWLIRHGDAIPGPDEIIPGGIYDNLPLSQKGREQARLLAERLQRIRFDAAYSSPLRRCQETATPTIDRLRLPLTLIEDVKEIYLGNIAPVLPPGESDNLAALSKALEERQKEIVRIASNSGSWDSLQTTEPSKAFRQRVVAAIDGIARHHIGDRVLIFAHGGVINAYVAEVLGLDKEFFFPCANTSITITRVQNRTKITTRVLYTLNDIAHLNVFSTPDNISQ